MAILEKVSHDAKLDSKIGLIRGLFRKDWKRDDIIALLNFIDWVVALPKSSEEKFIKEIDILEEEMNVQYLNTFERRGLKKGIEQGIVQGIDLGVEKGEAAILLRQLRKNLKRYRMYTVKN